MKKERKWENAPLNEATDSELSCFLDELTEGRMSYPHYELGKIVEVVKDVYVSKGDILGTYFDDILNSCKTYDEIIEYVKELKEKWEE